MKSLIMRWQKTDMHQLVRYLCFDPKCSDAIQIKDRLPMCLIVSIVCSTLSSVLLHATVQSEGQLRWIFIRFFQFVRVWTPTSPQRFPMAEERGNRNGCLVVFNCPRVNSQKIPLIITWGTNYRWDNL